MEERFEGYTEIVIDQDAPVFSIGVVSRLTEIPVWTLRILDRECIVCPRKSDGNTRLYSNADVRQLGRIRYLMKVRKVNVGGLKVILEMERVKG